MENEKTIKEQVIETLQKLSEEDFKDAADRWLGMNGTFKGDMMFKSFISIAQDYIL